MRCVPKFVRPIRVPTILDECQIWIGANLQRANKCEGLRLINKAKQVVPASRTILGNAYGVVIREKFFVT